MKNIKDLVCLLILLSLLCTSCIISNTIIEGLINAKIIYFLFVIGILVILSPIIYSSTETNFFYNTLDVSVGIFFCYIIVNNSFASNNFFIADNAENIALIVLYISAKKILSKKNNFTSKILPPFLLSLTAGQIITACLQWFNYIPSFNTSFRFTGFFFNPDPFAIFLSILLCNCLIIALYNTNRVIKFLAILIFFIGLPIIIVTVCRAAWSGFFAGVIFILFQKFNIIKVRVGLISLIIACLIFLPYFLYNLKQDSADGRVLIYEICWKMIQSHPLFGIGQGGIKSSFLKFQSQYFFENSNKMASQGQLADQVWYAFNDFLQLTVEQGVIGLLLLISVLSVCTRYSYQVFANTQGDQLIEKNKACVIGGISSILIIVVSGLFSYPLVMLPIKIIFVFCLAILSVKTHGLKNAEFNIAIPRILKTNAAIFCFLIGTAFIAYSINLYFAYGLENSLTAFGDNKNVLNRLNKYSGIVNDNIWYTLIESDDLIKNGDRPAAIIILENLKKTNSDTRIYYSLGLLYDAQKKYKQAEDQYRFLYYALPNLLKPKYMLALLYYKTCQFDKLKKITNEIINFKPKIVSRTTRDMVLVTLQIQRSASLCVIKK